MPLRADFKTRLEAIAKGIDLPTEVSWWELPTGLWKRACLLTPAGAGQIWTHEGVNALINPRVQIDWYAEKQSEASALYEACLLQLQDVASVTVGGTEFLPPFELNMHLFDTDQIGGTESSPGRKVYRAMQDFSFFAQPAA